MPRHQGPAHIHTHTHTAEREGAVSKGRQLVVATHIVIATRLQACPFSLSMLT